MSDRVDLFGCSFFKDMSPINDLKGYNGVKVVCKLNLLKMKNKERLRYKSKKLVKLIFFFLIILFSKIPHSNAFPSTGIQAHYYELNIHVFPSERSIKGFCKIHLSNLNEKDSVISIDLKSNFKVDSVWFNGRSQKFERIKDKINITNVSQKAIIVYYHGKPPEAPNPPWKGGFVWDKHKNQPWIGVACQGLGASSWWPCLDSWGSEPDSIELNFTVPKGLVCIANGKLSKITEQAESTTFKWKVSYPINLYNVTLNVADYKSFHRAYKSPSGKRFQLSYHVLGSNLKKAKRHFKQVKGMLNTYENLFGPYPFARDGYKIVETSYWGMEHQSAISYGNNYENNASGFDFIIIHESAHEYWGNSLSGSSPVHMWIHEAFATYTESLFIEKTKGLKESIEYLKMQKLNIKNEKPIYDESFIKEEFGHDTDMYYKGSWMLHSIRNTIAHDSLWFSLIKDFHETYKYKIINTEEAINFFNSRTDYNLRPIFKHFLTLAHLPKIELLVENETESNKALIKYRWTQAAEGFNMPIDVVLEKEKIRIYPSTKWGELQTRFSPSSMQVPKDNFLFEQ